MVSGTGSMYDALPATDVGALDLSLSPISNNLLKIVTVGEGKTTNRLLRLPVYFTVPQSLAGCMVVV